MKCHLSQILFLSILYFLALKVSVMQVFMCIHMDAVWYICHYRFCLLVQLLLISDQLFLWKKVLSLPVSLYGFYNMRYSPSMTDILLCEEPVAVVRSVKYMAFLKFKPMFSRKLLLTISILLQMIFLRHYNWHCVSSKAILIRQYKSVFDFSPLAEITPIFF